MSLQWVLLYPMWLLVLRYQFCGTTMVVTGITVEAVADSVGGQPKAAACTGRSLACSQVNAWHGTSPFSAAPAGR